MNGMWDLKAFPVLITFSAVLFWAGCPNLSLFLYIALFLSMEEILQIISDSDTVSTIYSY